MGSPIRRSESTTPPGTPSLPLYPPVYFYTPNGTVHNITNSFYPDPPNTHENDPHRVDLRSPNDRDGCELNFDSPDDKNKAGSSEQHARKK